MDGTVVERLIVEWRAEYDQYKADMRQVKETTNQTKNELDNMKKVVQQTRPAVSSLGGEFKSQFMAMVSPIAIMMASMRALKLVINSVADAVKLAMDVTESENLFETSLGKMADSTRAWSEQLAASLGVNSFEIRRVVGLWYTMAESMGFSSQQALTMSKNLVQLKYDLMSFYNVGGDQADTIIKGMLSGESEPAKAIGVILTDEMAKRQLLAKGIIKEGQEVDSTTMAYGRYLAMMGQTGKAQGDMARTIDSPANALRQFQATIEDIKLSIGEAFLPIYQTVIPALQTFAGYLKAAAQLVSAFSKNTSATETAGLKGSAAFDQYGKSAEIAFNKAASGASKLRATIMGFDELNVMNDNVAASTGGSGATGGNSMIPDLSEIELPEADATDFKKQVTTLVNFVDKNWGRIKWILTAAFPPLALPIAIADAFRSIKKIQEEALPQYRFVPDDISETTRAKLEPVLTLFNDIQVTAKEWAWSNKMITKDMADTMSAAVSQMGVDIKTAIKDQADKSYSIMADYFKNSSALSSAEEAAALSALQKNSTDRQTEIDRYTKSINEIYATAAKEHRSLTEEEQSQVNSLQEQMKIKAIAATSESADEQQRILRHLQVASDEISARQAADIVKNSLAAKAQTVNDAIDRCDKIIAEADRMKEAGLIDEKTYAKIVGDALSQRDSTISAAEATHLAVVDEARKQAGEHVGQVDWETGEVKRKWDLFKEEVVGTFRKLRDDVLGIVADILRAIDKIFNPRKANLEVGTTYSSGGYSQGHAVEMYADGGYPSPGELFVAREAGPELVGRMGNRSAVANNDQIVEGVANGVAKAIAPIFNQQQSQPVLNIYLDGVFDRQATAAARRNIRAGKTVSAMGVT